MSAETLRERAWAEAQRRFPAVGASPVHRDRSVFQEGALWAPAVVAADTEATHTEWGVRYTAPHPEPDRRYPVPSEEDARMLADDPEGCAVAVFREVSCGPWRDAEEASR